MTKQIFAPMERGKDVMLGTLPFYHIYGSSPPCSPRFSGRLIGPVSGCVLLLPFAFLVSTPIVIMPQFEPDAFCRYVEKYKVTAALIVPPVCLAILHHPGTGLREGSMALSILDRPMFFQLRISMT